MQTRIHASLHSTHLITELNTTIDWGYIWATLYTFLEWIPTLNSPWIKQDILTMGLKEEDELFSRGLCFPEILVLPINCLYRVSVYHLMEGQLQPHGDVWHLLLSALTQQLLLYLRVAPNNIKQKLPSSFILLSCNLCGFIHWFFSFCIYRSSRNWVPLF